ncbi:glycosyltransferase [Paenibacillus sp. TRM 82003]|nr:glycosyltransferase [Paenibacillus sp. TRM 82003]
MRIRMLTLGTRGDVQPFVALGVELRRRGHDVAVCTAVNFEGFVRGHGVDFVPIRADFLKFTQSEEGKKMLGGNPLEIMKNMKKLIYPMMETMLEDSWTAARDADVLIYHPKAFGGYDLAEKLDIPAFPAHPIPIIAPTGGLTNPALPVSTDNRWLNRRSYEVNRLLLGSFMGMINRWRRETLGLAGRRSVFTNDLRVRGRELPVLYGCSPAVVPFDPEWEGRVCMKGFWFLPERGGGRGAGQPGSEWTPPEALERFLAAGDAPIVVSFSSMPLKDPERTLGMLREGLALAGRRGVVLTGWSGMRAAGDAGDDVLCLEEAPHDWLFPRAAGVIHHGGAGTTAAALRAGVPMTICPFSADQPFWARRMLALGVSPAPLPEKAMSAPAFAARIAEMTGEASLRLRAEEIAASLASENGVAATADFVERYAREFARREA